MVTAPDNGSGFWTVKLMVTFLSVVERLLGWWVWMLVINISSADAAGAARTIEVDSARALKICLKSILLWLYESLEI